MAVPVKYFYLFLHFYVVTGFNDDFSEELFIKPLPTGHIYSHFQFTTEWEADFNNISSAKHYHLFPKALGEVLTKYQVDELHLSLTGGQWRHAKWGYPVLDTPPGAQLWVWFNERTSNIDETWTELINVLSGMFCASLNFMDSSNTVIPKMSFRPHGLTSQYFTKRFGQHVRYSALPRENVCTENLTPWKKLLPCGSKAGIASLFNSAKIYDASFTSLSVNFRTLCRDSACTKTYMELSQTLSTVFEPPVHNTMGMQDWSLRKMFGNRMIFKACPVASTSRILIDISSNKTEEYYFTLTPEPEQVTEFKRATQKFKYAIYYIRDQSINIAAKYNTEVSYHQPTPPVIHAHRFQTGYGQEKGGIMTLLYNHHPKKSLDVAIMETIPWFLRVYLHTLNIETFNNTDIGKMSIATNGTKVKPIHLHYVPGQDRKRPYHLELMVSLPPNSVTRVSFNFDRALLKWTEYPPDANHGFYVNSAVITSVVPTARFYTSPTLNDSHIASVLTDTSKQFFIRIYTESLLVTLPTPDFSMPYNVICLACTVVAIAFGSIHNLTTRGFTAQDPTKQKGLVTKIKEKLFFWKKKPSPKEDGNDSGVEEDESQNIDQCEDKKDR